VPAHPPKIEFDAVLYPAYDTHTDNRRGDQPRRLSAGRAPMTWLPITLATALIIIASGSGAHAATMFQLLGSAAVEAVDEASSFPLTQDGITATLTANVGVLNTTSSGFGVNHPLVGDPTDGIDAFFGDHESVTLTFNQAVTLDQVVLSLFTPSGGELASLTIDGFPTLTLIPMTPATDVYNFSTNNTVLVGQSIVLAHVAGNGFSFDSLTVSAVPEPSAFIMLLVGIGVVARYRARGLTGRADSR
jgi:hypothetical protein